MAKNFDVPISELVNDPNPLYVPNSNLLRLLNGKTEVIDRPLVPLLNVLAQYEIAVDDASAPHGYIKSSKADSNLYALLKAAAKILPGSALTTRRIYSPRGKLLVGEQNVSEFFELALNWQPGARYKLQGAELKDKVKEINAGTAKVEDLEDAEAPYALYESVALLAEKAGKDLAKANAQYSQGFEIIEETYRRIKNVSTRNEVERQLDEEPNLVLRVEKSNPRYQSQLVTVVSLIENCSHSAGAFKNYEKNYGGSHWFWSASAKDALGLRKKVEEVLFPALEASIQKDKEPVEEMDFLAGMFE